MLPVSKSHSLTFLFCGNNHFCVSAAPTLKHLDAKPIFLLTKM